MPWRETSPMDQRTPFIADHLRDTLSITELCLIHSGLPHFHTDQMQDKADVDCFVWVLVRLL